MGAARREPRASCLHVGRPAGPPSRPRVVDPARREGRRGQGRADEARHLRHLPALPRDSSPGERLRYPQGSRTTWPQGREEDTMDACGLNRGGKGARAPGRRAVRGSRRHYAGPHNTSTTPVGNGPSHGCAKYCVQKGSPARREPFRHHSRPGALCGPPGSLFGVEERPPTDRGAYARSRARTQVLDNGVFRVQAADTGNEAEDRRHVVLRRHSRISTNKWSCRILFTLSEGLLFAAWCLAQANRELSCFRVSLPGMRRHARGHRQC